MTHHPVLPHKTNSLATPLSHAKASKNSSEGRGADSNFHAAHAARRGEAPICPPARLSKGSPPRSPWELTLGASPSRLSKLSHGIYAISIAFVAAVTRRSCGPNWNKSNCSSLFLPPGVPFARDRFSLNRRQSTERSGMDDRSRIVGTHSEVETLFSR